MSETTTTKGVIDTILDKGRYDLIRIAGNGYFVWEAGQRALISQSKIAPGMDVAIEHNGGQYPRVKEIKVLGQQELSDKSVAVPPLSKPTITKELPFTQQDSILRSVALKAAVEIVSECNVVDIEGKPDDK